MQRLKCTFLSGIMQITMGTGLHILNYFKPVLRTHDLLYLQIVCIAAFAD